MIEINKTVKCIHCNNELVLDLYTEGKVMCSCGSLVIYNGVISEGVMGIDWIDISPKLLNE